MFKMLEIVNRKLESIRSQFFWGGDGIDKRISWVQWKQVLNSKEKGGLGVGSLKALNLALIQKWRWRYYMDTKGIWIKIIASIHGQHGGFGSYGTIHKRNGVWSSILKAIDQMHTKDIIPISTVRKRIGNGASTRF